MSCPLCNLEIRTKLYVQSKYFIVVNCDTCEGGDEVPLIVCKRHTTELNQEEMIDLMWILHYIWMDGIRGGLDQERRKIPDHWHAHIR